MQAKLPFIFLLLWYATLWRKSLLFGIFMVEGILGLHHQHLQLKVLCKYLAYFWTLVHFKILYFPLIWDCIVRLTLSRLLLTPLFLPHKKCAYLVYLSVCSQYLKLNNLDFCCGIWFINLFWEWSNGFVFKCYMKNKIS